MPIYPTCDHNSARKSCRLLTMNDISKFHSAFYSTKDKMKQDSFLLKYCKESSPARKRNKKGGAPKKVIYHYFVVNSANVLVEVCRNSFLGILGITKHRVIGVFQRFKKDDSLVPHETRGGDRKSEAFSGKKESVISFIKMFKGVESHYSRGKSKRVYLSSDLNCSKMFAIYDSSTDDVNLKVKESYFRFIFNTRFNASFSAPLTDVCSTCLELNERLKQSKNKNDEKEIETLEVKKRIHKLQAKSFFEKLREKQEGLYTISFDMQKNLPLPKLPDQIAYYSRQLYCYNLAVISGPSSAPLDCNSVSIYTWCENDMQKSSNQIASAVFNELCEKNKNCDFEKVNMIRLVADGCAGQNKNANVLSMCSFWLLKHAPENVKSIELVFPVTGHSFLPADRVFGLLEKEFRNKSTIIEPSEYFDVFSKYGTVKQLGRDWTALNWREDAKQIIKSTQGLHFSISKCKRFRFVRNKRKNNILVAGELAYRTDTAKLSSITKKGKTISAMNPTTIQLGCKINPKKLTDVKTLLLKHFGEGWEDLERLKWYSNILRDLQNSPDVNIVPDDFEDPCECEDFINETENDFILSIV